MKNQISIKLTEASTGSVQIQYRFTKTGLFISLLSLFVFVPGYSILFGQSSLPPACAESDDEIVCVYDQDDTFTVPEHITQITVEAWGAGGGGGFDVEQGKGGGGGGAYARSEFTVNPGDSYQISIGQGGQTGEAGGGTYFDTNQTLYAKGGEAGNRTSGGLGGSATNSIGDVVYSGGDGGDGQIGGGPPVLRAGGGGGGSAFNFMDGNPGEDGNAGTPGSGGSGTGSGGDGSTGIEVPGDGVAPGGGGGGGGANIIGASGADGRVVVRYVIEPNTFYSRVSGNWTEPNTWTLDENHVGPAAVFSPREIDTVFISSNHTVFLDDDIENNAQVFVQDTGTLITGGNILSGNGMFELQAGGTLEIWSQEGITLSGPSGSIQTGQRIFSSGASYHYNGDSTPQVTGDALPLSVENLTINNPVGVIVSPSMDLTVNGTLTLNQGIFSMPPGRSLVTSTGGVNASGGGQIRMQQVIDGGQGYRMLSSPLATNYEDLLNGFVTQGLPGSDWPDRQPNLLYFEETYADSGITANQSWRTIPGLLEDTMPGRGYFFYIFGDVDGDSDYSDPLPKTMTATGLEPEFNGPGSTFEFDITYTPIRETTRYLEGWNLVSNPTTATLDWDHPEWSRENIDETIYVWDPNANNGAGDYLVWNGVEGTLPDNGLIAPFQAFWVKANSPDPAMNITDQVKTTGADWVGTEMLQVETNEQEILSLGMNLQVRQLESDIFLTFMDEGEYGDDRYDAYRLQPMTNSTYLSFYTSNGNADDAPLQINNLPRDLTERIIIPVQVGGVENGEAISDEFSLEWKLPDNWPHDWSVVLMDHVKKKGISMINRDSYTFWHESKSNNGLIMQATEGQNMQPVVAEASHGYHLIPQNLIRPAGIVAPEQFSQKQTGSNSESVNLQSQNQSSEARFTIVIEPGGDTASDVYIPQKTELLQNYPNPFNSSTHIRVALPENGDLVLEVYDMIGRRVATLANGTYPAGTHNFNWDAHGAASGMYIYRLRSGDTVQSKKMLLVK